MAWFNNSDGHFVYWLSDGFRPLYVGFTENPSRRISEHRRHKSWFRDVVNVDICRYETREEALKTEAFEIMFGEGLHNIDLHRRRSFEAFEDARNGIHYPVLERYQEIPVRRF